MSTDTISEPIAISVPADFPRKLSSGCVSGTQPKILLVQSGGRFTQGPSEEERAGRFLMCDDLVQQIVAHTRRKQLERLDLTLEQLLVEIDKKMRTKGWEVYPPEFDWIMGRVRSEMFSVVSSSVPPRKD